MARSITASRIHKRWCNSHDTLDIKMVTLQGRTEQKLDWQFDPWNTTTLIQSSKWTRYWSLFLLVIPKQNGLTDHKSSGIDEHGCITTPDYQLIDEGQKTTKEGQLKEHMIFGVVDAQISMSNRVQNISSG